MSIYTIGYEGLDIDNFLKLLQLEGVKTVVDIRELPLSRKRGFSKNALRAVLQANGFGYRHVVALGCPKPIRDQYRQDGDWKQYKKDFKRYLSSQTQVVSEVSELAQTQDCALLCFEANYQMCHRSMVADAMQRISGLEVAHISSISLKTATAAQERLALA